MKKELLLELNRIKEVMGIDPHLNDTIDNLTWLNERTYNGKELLLEGNKISDAIETLFTVLSKSDTGSKIWLSANNIITDIANSKGITTVTNKLSKLARYSISGNLTAKELLALQKKNIDEIVDILVNGEIGKSINDGWDNIIEGLDRSVRDKVIMVNGVEQTIERTLREVQENMVEDFKLLEEQLVEVLVNPQQWNFKNGEELGDVIADTFGDEIKFLEDGGENLLVRALRDNYDKTIKIVDPLISGVFPEVAEVQSKFLKNWTKFINGKTGIVFADVMRFLKDFLMSVSKGIYNWIKTVLMKNHNARVGNIKEKWKYTGDNKYAKFGHYTGEYTGRSLNFLRTLLVSIIDTCTGFISQLMNWLADWIPKHISKFFKQDLGPSKGVLNFFETVSIFLVKFIRTWVAKVLVQAVFLYAVPKRLAALWQLEEDLLRGKGPIGWLIQNSYDTFISAGDTFLGFFGYGPDDPEVQEKLKVILESQKKLEDAVLKVRDDVKGVVEDGKDTLDKISKLKTCLIDLQKDVDEGLKIGGDVDTSQIEIFKDPNMKKMIMSFDTENLEAEGNKEVVSYLMDELSNIDLGLNEVKIYTDLAGGDIDELLVKCEEAKKSMEKHNIELKKAGEKLKGQV